MCMAGTFLPTLAPTAGSVTETTGLPAVSGIAAYDRLTGIVPAGFQPPVVASRSVPRRRAGRDPVGERHGGGGAGAVGVVDGERCRDVGP